MSTFTKEQLIARINQVTAINKYRISRDPDADGLAMDNELFAIALASLEAEAVGEVVLGEYDDCGCHPDARVECIAADGQADWENFKDGTRLYAAPPSMVVIDERAAFNAWNNDENLPIAGVGAKNAAWLAWQARVKLAAPPAPVSMKDHQIRELVNELRDIAVEYHGTQQLRERIARTIRAAMLQGAEPVMTAYKLSDDFDFDRFNDVVWLEALASNPHMHSLTTSTIAMVALELNRKLAALDSSVIPDDVRRMDWLVSKIVDVREPMVYGSHSLFWSQTITDEEDEYRATKLREQIDAAMAAEQAAAPQQEVKS